MLEGEGSVTGENGRRWIYISSDVSKDSAFPFEKGEKVKVKIEGKKIIIEKKE